MASANKATPSAFDLSRVRNRIIEHIDLLPSEIQDHPGQAWDHPVEQAKALVGILSEVGIVDDLLIYKSERAHGAWVTIDGHLRKSLDPHKPWPCTVLDVTDEEADYILATHDPVGMMKLTNKEALDALLAEISTSDTAVQKMLADVAERAGLYMERPSPSHADSGAEVDRAAELQAKWQVEAGQIWQMGAQRLICGSCTDASTVQRLLAGNKVQLVLTSPPYAVGKEYEIGVTWSEHLTLLRGFADMALSVVDPGGFIFVNFGDIHPIAVTEELAGSERHCSYPISKDYWQIFHEERKCDLHAMRIWRKPFNKLGKPFFAFGTSLAHQQEWEHLWTWRTPGGGKDKVYDLEISLRAVWDTSEEQGDKPLVEHVAAFPIGIPQRALRAHTDEGAAVWEPFCGSGTTLIACEQFGRRGFGCELQPTYCAVILERYLKTFGVEPQRIT